MDTKYNQRWGLGEGNIWHFTEYKSNIKKVVLQNGEGYSYPYLGFSEPSCGYDGYVCIDTVFILRSKFPELNYCEVCKLNRIMQLLEN